MGRKRPMSKRYQKSQSTQKSGGAQGCQGSMQNEPSEPSICPGRGSSSESSVASHGEPRNDHKPAHDASQKKLQCTVCHTEFDKSTLHTRVLETDVGKWIQLKGEKKTLRKEKLNSLFKTVNALLNSGGGVLYLHVETKMLLFLDEQLDDKLMKFIPDGSLFSDSYERRVEEDGVHLRLRVKPRDGSKPLCTLNFKTKTSTNKGLADPSQMQMRQLMKGQRDRSNDNSVSSFTPSILTGESLVEGGTLKSFHEHTGAEAKYVKEDIVGQGEVLKGEALLSYAWNDLKLPERITSFSKEEDGGSYCLGIGQEEQNQSRLLWKESKDNRGIVLPDDDWKIWVSENESETEDKVFHVAKLPKVKKTQNCTGAFLCNGVPLPDNEHDNFEKKLQNNICKNMLWCWGEKWTVANCKDQVKVLFHPLRDRAANNGCAGNQQTGASSKMSGRYIIEVQVKRFSGLCFWDHNGPEAYEFEHPSNFEKKDDPCRISSQQWWERQMRDLSTFTL